MVKTIFKKKKKVKELHHPPSNFMTSNNATVIKIAWY